MELMSVEPRLGILTIRGLLRYYHRQGVIPK
jgi:hypothetical protein